MNDPKVSVVIPAYNGARFLGETIQSVLDQTYPHFELIVVDDASTDNTAYVVKQFNDPRIRYILHKENRGAIAARYTGNQVSQSEIVAFLDQDDFFHPDKLQTHIKFHEEHPEIGLTYNSRFELNYSSKTIREIRQAPQVITLADLILGFPITPSDMVLRREWALMEDVWDDSFITSGVDTIVNGGEYVFLGRLWLAGCKFANVERTLNYRRHQSGRVFTNLSLRCRSERTCQEIIFSDPRCPKDVVALRHIAFSNTYLVWTFYAFGQKETGLGQKFVQEAVQLNPSILDGKPAKLVELLTYISVADENENHESYLKSAFDQLPPEFASLSEQFNWAVATGYLLKGVREIIWNNPDKGQVYFTQATKLNAKIEESFMRYLASQLLCFQAEFGYEAGQKVFNLLVPYLEKIGGRESIRQLWGHILINQAFLSYRKGDYAQVPRMILRAITKNPKYLFNRGALAILFRSIVNRATQMSLQSAQTQTGK